ncbi:dihydropteroate synthase [Marmoricola sp. OAE513]|uniref:dihydropteroate synthase n=1 Tax=Marmoricola sp. OAE513 TaxID=2817894 RepID=UPI001AEB8FA1
MGVLNVTPDSFSDGGLYADVEAAITHGLALLAQGADVLDIGGESTRPGATRPLVAEELSRVVPVISGLVERGAVVSVDTMRAQVADAALAAGATLVNDVSGGLADPEILGVVADRGAPYVAMHWRAHATEMAGRATYDDVVREVGDELVLRVQAALGAGISADRLAVDPGLGFAKTAEHNWELLRRLEELERLGLPVLLGASRKSFLGSLLAGPDGAPRDVADREDANVAISTLAARTGVWCLRVHEVRRTVDALRVVAQVEGREFVPSDPAGRVDPA